MFIFEERVRGAGPFRGRSVADSFFRPHLEQRARASRDRQTFAVVCSRPHITTGAIKKFIKKVIKKFIDDI